MSNLVGKQHARPWYMQTHPRSGRNPFSSLGLDYCLFCKQEVDTDTEAHVKDNTYVYRRRCTRCGQTINWGVYNNCMLIDPPSNLTLAYEWVTERGEDRT